MIRNKSYKVRGLLKRGNKVKPFSITVKAASAHKADKMVREGIESYCQICHPLVDPVQCIINKKTVRVRKLLIK